jgi:hypothetical protein
MLGHSLTINASKVFRAGWSSPETVCPTIILQVRVPWGDDALMSQILQGFAQNEDWLRRQHRHTLNLTFKVCLDGGSAEPIAEKLENELLLLLTSRPGTFFDFGYISGGEMSPEDVLHILRYLINRINVELPFGLEVSKLKNEVNRHREGKHAIDQLTFRLTQIEVKEAVIFREAWQTVKIVDFLGCQNRQTAGVRGHARATFSECKKYAFCTASRNCISSYRQAV